MESGVRTNQYTRQVSINLTSGVTYAVGAVGGSAGYLFEDDRKVCVLRLFWLFYTYIGLKCGGMCSSTCHRYVANHPDRVLFPSK